MKEKFIPDFPMYKIREDGKIFSRYKPKTNKIWDKWVELKPVLDKSTGYYLVTLSNGKIKKNKFIHRLLAEAFIPNPENKCCVNHKNTIKTDNRLENLEWVTIKENNQHAIKMGIIPHRPNKKQVNKYSLNGKYLTTYNSISEAAINNNCHTANIAKVCNFKRKSTGGFQWRFLSEEYPKNKNISSII